MKPSERARRGLEIFYDAKRSFIEFRNNLWPDPAAEPSPTPTSTFRGRGLLWHAQMVLREVQKNLLVNEPPTFLMTTEHRKALRFKVLLPVEMSMEAPGM